MQEAAGDIDALVKGAQAAMMGGRDPVAVYRLLGSIGARAGLLGDQVNSEAGEVGAASLEAGYPGDVAAYLLQRWIIDEKRVVEGASHA